jgi:sugar/nucleoside kinase (ribokinase family)
MVDIFIGAGDDFPERWGLSDPVQHVTYDALTKILAALPEPVSVSGGGAANVAKIAALLGVSAGFVGAVGPDPYAARFEGDLTEAGVIPFLIREKIPTGLCLTLRRKRGGPVIAACPSAALRLSGPDVPEDLISAAAAVVLDGYILGRDALVHRVLDLADKHGTAVALDVGSAFQAGSRAAEIAGYCRDYPLILFMNEEEAAAYYRGLHNIEPGILTEEADEDPADYHPGDEKWGAFPPVIAEFFKKATAKELYPIIVVKRGKRGALVFAGGAMFRADTLAVLTAETTGAGDTFCAAFLAAWIRGKPLQECAALGNKAAREVLDVPGTRVDRKKLRHLAKQLEKSIIGH